MLDVSVRRPAVSWIRRGVHKQDWCRHEYTGSDTTRENDWKKNSWTETPCIVVLCYICQGKELWSTLIHRSNESKWHILTIFYSVPSLSLPLFFPFPLLSLPPLSLPPSLTHFRWWQVTAVPQDQMQEGQRAIWSLCKWLYLPNTSPKWTWCHLRCMSLNVFSHPQTIVGNYKQLWLLGGDSLIRYWLFNCWECWLGCSIVYNAHEHLCVNSDWADCCHLASRVGAQNNCMCNTRLWN